MGATKEIEHSLMFGVPPEPLFEKQITHRFDKIRREITICGTFLLNRKLQTFPILGTMDF